MQMASKHHMCKKSALSSTKKGLQATMAILLVWWAVVQLAEESFFKYLPPIGQRVNSSNNS